MTAVQEALISTEHERNPPLVFSHALAHEAGIGTGGMSGGAPGISTVGMKKESWTRADPSRKATTPRRTCTQSKV